jgi:TolB-like protein
MLSVALLGLSALAAPVVAIADLSNHTGDPQLDPAGPGVAGILVSRFAGSGVVDVVERDALESLLLEQQLTVDGLTEPRTAARAGRLLGADYLVVGELFSMQLPTLSVALRVVDTETGQVVVSEDVVGQIGADGSEFFQLIDALSTQILDGMDVSLDARSRLSAIEQRELKQVLRYGEDLLRVNLEHPRSLYRRSDRDFDVPPDAEGRWAVYDKRGYRVRMPELSRRVGDDSTLDAYYARLRSDHRRAVRANLITGAYGVAGAGLFVGGVAVSGNNEDVGTGLAVGGLATMATCGINFGVNAIVQTVRRSSKRRPTNFYRADEADRWIQKYNRSLD